MSKTTFSDSTPELVAIVQAARKSGNRRLERSARRELLEAQGIRLSFRGSKPKLEAAQ